jgi:hypothetical protein
MAYSGTYTSADLDDIFIDLVAEMGVMFVAFASLIAIVMVWRWFNGKSTGI